MIGSLSIATGAALLTVLPTFAPFGDVSQPPSVRTRARVATHAPADSLLTADALNNMAAFWTAFMKEPATITGAGRKAHQKPLSVDVGGGQPLQLSSVLDIPGRRDGFDERASHGAAVGRLPSCVVRGRRCGAKGPHAAHAVGKHGGRSPSHRKELTAAYGKHNSLNRTPMLFTAFALLTFVSALGSGTQTTPQDSTRPRDGSAARRPILTVRPRTMATGTRTEKAGAQLLDSARQTWAYVPPQCVGTRRCPLVVVLGGAAINSMEMVNFMRPLSYRSHLADRYGMILLAPEAAAYPGVWDVIAGTRNGTTAGSWTSLGMRVTQFPDTDVRNIDAALKYVLSQFAIDPDKIAVEGFSNGGSYALFLGRSNPQVFSRIAAVSPVFPIAVDDPPHQSTQLFISGGVAEGGIMRTWIGIAHKLRQEGHVVDMVPGLRGHMDFGPDKDYEWQWLAQSWNTGPALAPVRIAADAEPVLTPTILKQMTQFWTRFQREPDSIRTIARVAHEVPLALAIGPDSVSVVATSMTKLAAQYPSVAADLAAAGLTAQQADRYRAAIVRVGVAHLVGVSPKSVSKTSAFGRNLTLRETDDQAFDALGKTGMWVTP